MQIVVKLLWNATCHISMTLKFYSMNVLRERRHVFLHAFVCLRLTRSGCVHGIWWVICQVMTQQISRGYTVTPSSSFSRPDLVTGELEQV